MSPKPPPTPAEQLIAEIDRRASSPMVRAAMGETLTMLRQYIVTTEARLTAMEKQLEGAATRLGCFSGRQYL